MWKPAWHHPQIYGMQKESEQPTWRWKNSVLSGSTSINLFYHTVYQIFAGIQIFADRFPQTWKDHLFYFFCRRIDPLLPIGLSMEYLAKRLPKVYRKVFSHLKPLFLIACYLYRYYFLVLQGIILNVQ